jgi:cadmium resistance protein CadD (predicted permease)
MSWAAFWIDPENAGPQIGVATSSMLTLIAYRFMLGNLLPKVAYMTRLDYFILASTILVFLTLIEVLITTALVKANQAPVARRWDLSCRWLFPMAFLLLMATLKF